MPRTIEHRIEVSASAAAIWPLIADVAGWPRTSGGLYPEAQGALIPGRTLALKIALPGLTPQAAQPVVEQVVPDSRLVYVTRTMGGLLVARRLIELRTLGRDRTEIVNGETMGGLLGPVIAALVGGKMRAGFTAMKAALKARAEAA